MKIKNVFLLLFFSIFSILNISVGACMVWYDLVSLLQFLIMQVINIGVAYGLTELFLSLAIKKKDLPKLNKLSTSPAVALLYVTYNDVIPELLSKLKDQTYKNYDIFVLDDSSDERCKKLVDECAFRTIRRKNRTGFKAGALNNWLSLYSDKYNYFVIADSDSLFKDDFIEKMVKYAEHPSNKNIAIFQSKIKNWNTKNAFPRTIATMVPLSNYIIDKLANECSTIISLGHNNLHRTELIRQVDGFDENFVAEDYATGLNLISRGYECKIVDVSSYDMTPEMIKSYTKRYVRWAKQTVELLKLDTEKIPFNTKLHLFMAAYHYLIHIVFFLGILIVVWGYNSSFDNLFDFMNIMIGGKFVNTSLLLPLILVTFYILNFTFLRLPLALKLGISVKDYCKNLLLSMAVGYYVMFPLIKEQIKTISGNKTIFDVTDKSKSKISFFQMVKEYRFTNLFIIFILLGIVKNPLSLIFNFIWLIPLIVSPVIIYLIQKD